MQSYFDHNATTPVSPEVLSAFTQAAAEAFGNPSSIHGYGQRARQQVEAARQEVALWLGCDAKEIVFTSGGTEADNLALYGVMIEAQARGTAKPHLITDLLEHPAILGTSGDVERRGCALTVVSATPQGTVDPAAIREALRPDTKLISVMHANNETGAVQPMREVVEIAREAGVLVHSDGVQAAGKLHVNVRELGVDLYSVSGHKIYAPKGIGALYVRDGVKLRPVQYGGRHERERRAGTENVPGIVAMGAAAKWMREHAEAEQQRLQGLRDRLEQRIVSRVPGAFIHSAEVERTPNTTNIAFDGVEGEALVIALDLAGFAVSTGAACSSGAVRPSHVLLAMGLTPAQAKSSIRFSLGRGNTQEQVDALVDAVEASVARLRKLSPVFHHA